MSPKKKKRKFEGPPQAAVLFRKYFIYLLVIIVLIVGMVATVRIIKAPKENDGETVSNSVNLEAGDTYRLAMYQPSSFNVLSSSDEDIVYINQLIYSYLFRLDETLNIVPDLVSEYKTNSSSGTVEITLRDDVRFSDGSWLDARDVSYTINRIKEIGTSSPYYRYASRIRNTEVRDGSNIRIIFEDPREAAMDNLVFPIVSSDDYSYEKDFNLGSGQFVFSDYMEGKVLRLEPNTLYHGVLASNGAEIQIVDDKSSVPGLITMDAVIAYMNKDQSIEAIAKDKGLRCLHIVSGELEYLGFNCNNPILSDSYMRQGIAYGINRDIILRDDYASAGVVSDSLYFPGFLGTDTKEGINFDPKSATNDFTAMGLKDIDEDGILETAEGEDVSFKLIVNAENSNRRDAANTIAEQLKTLGVEIIVDELSSYEFETALTYGDFDLYLAGISIDKQFNLKDLYEGANYGNYVGPEVMELTYQMEMAQDSINLSATFARLKSLLASEMPYLGICYKSYFFISTDTLNIKDLPLYFDPYRNMGEWSWQKRVAQDIAS